MEEEAEMEPCEVPEDIRKLINEDVSSSSDSKSEDGGQGSASEDWTAKLWDRSSGGVHMGILCPCVVAEVCSVFSLSLLRMA